MRKYKKITVLGKILLEKISSVEVVRAWSHFEQNLTRQQANKHKEFDFSPGEGGKNC